MTEKREFYASTVDEAVEKAAVELGMSSGEFDYQVLDEGNAGFLGIGARDARIVVETQEAEQGGVVHEEEVETDLPVEQEPEAPAARQDDAVETPRSLELSEVFGESSAGEQPEAPEELLAEIRDLITSLLQAMGFESGVDVYDAGGFVAADVTPDNTALFIGQKGETIDALQYLVNVAVYKDRPFVKRVVLDAEGYRQRRVEALQGMAHRTARRAVREHRTVELPPMNSSERRIVHLYLRDNPKVTTESEGSGDNRRVRVSPVR